MASRKPRDKPFLDDPSDYPEFALLVERQSLHHALRCGWHRNRAAALLLLLALSVAASGARVPPISATAAFGGGGGGSVADWCAYLAKGLNVDLLARHFEGIVSAIGCTLAATVISLLVHPLYSLTYRSSSRGGTDLPSSSASPSPTVITIAAALPSALIWSVAVWGAGNFRWGVAAGLCVGLQCAGLTLKSVSFVQACNPAPKAAGANGCGMEAAMIGTRDNNSGLVSLNGAPSNNGKHVVARSNGNSDGGGGGAVSTRTSAVATSSRWEDAGSADHDTPPTLTFGEFAFFLILTPSLVCAPRLLRRCARRPPNVIGAASEFVHAALTYLAVHATCSAFFAPALRVLALALHSSWADAEGWAALREDGSGAWLHNISVVAGGGGGDSYGDVVGDQEGLVTVAVAAAVGMFVFAPVMHFLMFYAFWHCVCVGSAHLWGYPDRNIYGPWWLVVDDLRDYFRMWSAPVYRWLADSVQRPILAAGRLAARRRVSSVRRCCQGNDNGHDCGGEKQLPRLTDGNTCAAAVSVAPVANAIAAPANATFNESVSKVVPLSTSIGGLNTSSFPGDRDNRADNCQCENRRNLDSSGVGVGWYWPTSVVCSFLVSGLLHEAVAFVAMRRTFWPFNTLFLAMSASMTPWWDLLFPALPAAARRTAAAGGTLKTSSRPAATAASGGEGAEIVRNGDKDSSNLEPDKGRSPPDLPSDGKNVAYTVRKAAMGLPKRSRVEGRHEAGSEGEGSTTQRRGAANRAAIGSWRGWTAIVFYMVASLPLTLTVDYLLWQWWRHTVLVG